MSGIVGVGNIVSPVAISASGVAQAGLQGSGSISGTSFGAGSAASVSFSDESQLLAQQLAQQTTSHGGGGGGHHGRVNNLNTLLEKVVVEDDDPEQLDSGLMALAKLMAGKNADTTDKNRQDGGSAESEGDSPD